MLRLRFAGGLALIVGMVTLVISILNDARPTTILYRSVISVSVFGLLGYLLGGLAEKTYLSKLADMKATEQKTAVMDEQPEPTLADNSEFAPFTPDKFEHISSSQD